jgi:hypothetical protein
MSVYLIWAAENKYSGLHGIYNVDVVECNSPQWADEMGRDMSYEVMTSYSHIEQDLEDEVMEIAERDGLTEEEEIDSLREEVYCENMTWRYWKLNEDYTEEEYREMLNDMDWEELCDKYAVKE